MADKLYVDKFIDDNDVTYWVRDSEAIHPQFTLKRYDATATVISENPVVTITLEDYIYSSDDIIEVYLNGFKARSSEYTVTGEDGTITITLAYFSFSGVLEAVVTKLTEEV